ncbi:hypothetical protein [Spirosoma panaciterrae]|uniref:hypothetical protein n=1 Tax=Spirosoma panaciterrae TaxID=496058 RepID=UPI0003675891|nr:hypothetical protein [Spirosoma panaciterrae]
MTIELYSTSPTDSSVPVESPISNTMGELPAQEPTLDLGNLLGSFDSREEALAFVQAQADTQQQQVTDSRIVKFDAYTHVELLTVTLQQADQSTAYKNFYLVLDEGY